MVLESAEILVKPGMEEAFEAGVREAAPLFRRAKGCSSMALRRSVEKPSHYVLVVGWETVEAHTVDFRGSAVFAVWRKLVGHCFASPPDVGHVHLEGYGGLERWSRREPSSLRLRARGRRGEWISGPERPG